MQNSEEKNGIFLVYTDVINSCELDRGKNIKWRHQSFVSQLEELLIHEGAFAVKSAGDALFITIKPVNGEQETQSICRELLHSVFQAFSKSKDIHFEIRVIVHFIEEPISGSNFSDDLKIDLDKNGKIGNSKYELLINTLKNDIFGDEVNRTVRLNSLAKERVILVTESVVSIAVDNYNDLKKNNSDLTFNLLEDQTYYFNYQLPIISLKGFPEIDIKKPYIIWELNNEPSVNIVPVLTKEFKKFNILRLLLVKLNDEISTKDEFSNLQRKIKNYINEKNNKDVLKFYTESTWKVLDYYTLNKIDFVRPVENIFNGDRMNNSILKGGHFNDLTYKSKLLDIINRPLANSLFLPYIIINNFPGNETAGLGRKLYDTNNEKIEFLDSSGSSNTFEIEPQSIAVYSSTVLDENVDINNSHFILMFFGIYSGHVSSGDDLKQIINFNKVEHSSGKIIPYIGAITTGLVDGFVIYKIGYNEFKNGTEEIIKKFDRKLIASEFYKNCYPINFFWLEHDIMSNDKS